MALTRLAAVACALGAAAAATTTSTTAAARKPSHVVLVMMENHSFDNMLGWLTLNNSAVRGLTGQESNVNPADNKTYTVTQNGAMVDPDPDHSVPGTCEQIYTTCPPKDQHDPSQVTMGGFIANEIKANGAAWAPHIMDCIHPSHVPVLATLATEFTLIDGYHAGVPGPTFPNRLFAMSATSYGYGTNSVAQTLLGWPQKSIFGALDSANVSWRVYFSDFPSSWLFTETRTPASLAKSREFVDTFAADVAKGDLPAFTFIEPAYFSVPGIYNGTDQHPSHDVSDGERFLKSIYEALASSPVWNSTVLLVTYDEHGGFFDHIPTPVQGIPNPDGIACRDCGDTGFNFTRLGVRVPMVVAGPWVPKGLVLHEAPTAPASYYEHSSIPATLKNVFDLPSFLTQRDEWATPLDAIWSGAYDDMTSPRTDYPKVLPDPPLQFPAHVGKDMGHVAETMPPNHLQLDFMVMVEGVMRALEGEAAAPSSPQRDDLVSVVTGESGSDVVSEAEVLAAQVVAKLEASGVLKSEASAGRYTLARVKEIMGKVGVDFTGGVGQAKKA